MRSFENDGYGQFVYNQPVQRTSSQGNCGINAQNLNGTAGQCGSGTPFYVQSSSMLATQGGCESGSSNAAAQNACGVSGNVPLAQNACGTGSGSNALAQNGCVQNSTPIAAQSTCQDLYLAADGTICRNGEPLAQNYNGCNCSANASSAAMQSAGAMGRCMYQCITPAFFNAVYNGGNQDVAPEGEVCFLQAYQTGDFKFTPNCPVITCNTPGIYRIDYALTLRPSVGQVNAAYAVAICGEEHPFSCFGCYAEGLADEERQELYGSFLTNLTAGETLVLKNKSNTCNHLSSCTPATQTVNRASILIQRIA
jgi:hypothetical protein